VGYRNKRLQTVLAKIELKRAYYHCAVCRAGVIPKDVELDVARTCFSQPEADDGPGRRQGSLR
jgi:hypothetical protein